MTDNITDLIGLSRDRATRPDCEDAYLIGELADALEATVKEMHARELHHFEEEQARAEAEAERDRYRAEAESARKTGERILADALRYRAAIEEALDSLSENEDPDTVVIAILTRALNETREEQ